ncbi:protein RKD3-like [Magnolia sinica]|uniref:protein RKD3-like n=1 Tax=Magnolia sinica TaxID=86752 RepID=UPI002659F01F|nr:protein RKD3-like [Magnolia sinica]
MEKQSLDSWPLFEVVAKEEEPFWFQYQQLLDFSGESHLNWQAEVPIKEDVFGAPPLMESFVHEPCCSSMEFLPDHTNMLPGADDWYDSFDGGFGVLDDLSVKPQAKKDMVFCNEEESGEELKERKEERFREEGMVFCNGEEISSEEPKEMKMERAREEGMVFCNGEELKEKKVERCREDRSISFKELSRYFYMPITQAAKEMNVGLTLLKKRCRELGIPRWPHRKMKSLQTLIKNVQELGREDGEVGESQLRTAIEVLEQQKRMMEKIPAMEIGEKTKKLRQACFKANYKKKKLMGMVDSQPSSYTWMQD